MNLYFANLVCFTDLQIISNCSVDVRAYPITARSQVVSSESDAPI